MKELFFDFETYSAVDLKTEGAYNYACHSSTIVLCLGLKYGEDSILWFPEDGKLPKKWITRLESKKILKVAHNIKFDYLIATKVLKLSIPWEMCHCTMVQAYRLGLEGSLSAVAGSVGIKESKNTEGRRYLMEITRKGPDSVKGYEDKLKIVGDYCLQDVRLLEMIYQRLPDPQVPEVEKDLYLVDHEMNFKGIPVDIPGIKTLLKAVERFEKYADKMVPKISGGLPREALNSPLQLGAWLRDQGEEVPNCQATTLEKLFKTTKNKKVRNVLEYRLVLAQASIKKLGAMLLSAGEDKRIRLTMQYHGAHTGRWAGRGIQPQNLPRDCFNDKEFSAFIKKAKVETSIEIMRDMPRAIRKLIKAPAGKKFLIYDYSQIEARVLAWLVGQNDLVTDFKKGVDIYTKFAQSIGPKVSRQVGKTSILGLGFQMGAERFQDALKTMAGVSADLRFSQDVVHIYRRKYPKISGFWNTVEGCYTMAGGVKTPFKMKLANTELIFSWCSALEGVRLSLPSGRSIFYPHHFPTYGGKLTENIVQAIARDVMGHAIVELKKYNPIMLVHDEIIFEVDKKIKKSTFEKALLKAVPDWFDPDLVAFEGDDAGRYGK